MEIHNNEMQKKTGVSNKNKDSDDDEIIQMETDDGSSHSTYGTPEVDKPFSLSEWLDTESFPQSQNSMTTSWRSFTTDFLGVDKKLDDNIKDICEKHMDKMIDLRPYMIETVPKVTRFDYLPLILKTFQ